MNFSIKKIFSKNDSSNFGSKSKLWVSILSLYLPMSSVANCSNMLNDYNQYFKGKAAPGPKVMVLLKNTSSINFSYGYTEYDGSNNYTSATNNIIPANTLVSFAVEGGTPYYLINLYPQGGDTSSVNALASLSVGMDGNNNSVLSNSESYGVGITIDDQCGFTDSDGNVDVLVYASYIDHAIPLMTAVGQHNTILTSADGLNWQDKSLSPPNAVDFKFIAYSHDAYWWQPGSGWIAISNQQIFSASSLTQHWQQVKLPSKFYSLYPNYQFNVAIWSAIAWQWIIIGTSDNQTFQLTSHDGITWEIDSQSNLNEVLPPYSINSVTESPIVNGTTQFIATAVDTSTPSKGSAIFTSHDGENWQLSGNNGKIANTVIKATINYGQGFWQAIGYQNNEGAQSGTLLTFLENTWNNALLFGQTIPAVSAIALQNTFPYNFVAVGNGIVTNIPDGSRGLNYSVIPNDYLGDALPNLNAILWSGSVWTALGNNGKIVASSDARSWEPLVSPTTYNITSVAWNGFNSTVPLPSTNAAHVVIQVGNGVVNRSLDNGLTWSGIGLTGGLWSADLHAVAYGQDSTGNGLWVTGGSDAANQAVIFTSTIKNSDGTNNNGVNWLQAPPLPGLASNTKVKKILWNGSSKEWLMLTIPSTNPNTSILLMSMNGSTWTLYANGMATSVTDIAVFTSKAHSQWIATSNNEGGATISTAGELNQGWTPIPDPKGLLNNITLNSIQVIGSGWIAAGKNNLTNKAVVVTQDAQGNLEVQTLDAPMNGGKPVELNKVIANNSTWLAISDSSIFSNDKQLALPTAPGNITDIVWNGSKWIAIGNTLNPDGSFATGFVLIFDPANPAKGWEKETGIPYRILTAGMLESIAIGQ